MKLSSRKFAQPSRSTAMGSPQPAISGNHSRSSAVGSVADALDVLHHGEAERIGIDAGIARIVEVRLDDDVGVGVQELQHGPSVSRPSSCSRFMIV